MGVWPIHFDMEMTGVGCVVIHFLNVTDVVDALWVWWWQGTWGGGLLVCVGGDEVVTVCSGRILMHALGACFERGNWPRGNG